MLTAKNGDLDEAEALDTGADDFLSKPFSFVVLVAHLRALLRRGGREPLSVLSAGDLVVDSARHSCRRGEHEIRLTAREFSILEFLVRHAGEVVTKPEILANVWDFAYDGDPAVVEVHISAIRKKIDVPFDRAAIETIRNVGYRLVANGG
jgi:DNA-binding response OmpR family regulator